MKRTLALKRETLTELAPEDLGRIVGGTTPLSRTCALLTFAPCYVLQTVVDGCLG